MILPISGSFENSIKIDFLSENLAKMTFLELFNFTLFDFRFKSEGFELGKYEK